MAGESPEARERRFQVLCALETWGILGLGQLKGLLFGRRMNSQKLVRFFFNQTSKNHYRGYTYKVVRRLERRGYVKAHGYADSARLYTLTGEGHRFLKKTGRATLPVHLDHLAPSAVRHELHVNGVGLILTELLGLRVRTERDRYLWSTRIGRGSAPIRLAISDLWIVDRRQPKAVEVEMMQKSRLRYKETWQTYRRRLPENGVVLYLTNWPSGPRRLLYLARGFRADFIYVCGLKEFRESCGTSPFIGYERRQVLTLGTATAAPQGASDRRVPDPSLPGGELGSGTFAPPLQPAQAGALIPPASRGDQYVPPPACRALPRPHPLYSPSPSREGEAGGRL